MNFEKLTGLIAAPHTPFHEDGSVNLDIIPKQAAWLVKNGVTGAFICGTTGEGSSLTTQERLSIAERWVQSASTLKVIVHAGHNSLADSKTIASHAQKMGAHAIAAIAPGFFRPATIHDLVDFNAAIAAAAPELPFYFYHMPAMTGVNFPVIDFLAAAASRIPNLAGVKFTHENLMDYRQCVQFAGGKYDILFGRDEILLAALAMGAQGAVGSTYNFAAPLYLQVIDAFHKGDLVTARKFQDEAIEVISAFARLGGPAAGKAIMKMHGIDCGPVRPPLKMPPPEALAALRQQLMPYLQFSSATSRPRPLPC